MDGIFDKLEPNIRSIYKRLIDDVKADAISERVNEIDDRIEEFIEWVMRFLSSRWMNHMAVESRRKAWI